MSSRKIGVFQPKPLILTRTHPQGSGGDGPIILPLNPGEPEDYVVSPAQVDLPGMIEFPA